MPPPYEEHGRERTIQGSAAHVISIFSMIAEAASGDTNIPVGFPK